MISDEKFRKSEHLLKSKDFNKVYKLGRPYRSAGFVIYCLKNGSPVGRIGFSISSSSIKLATRRNRIRRILKEVFRKKKRSFRFGYDIVVSIKKDPGAPIAYDKLEELFLGLIKQAGVI